MITMNIAATVLSLFCSFIITILYFNKFDPFIAALIAVLFLWSINRVKRHLNLFKEKRIYIVAICLCSIFAISQVIGANIDINEKNYNWFPLEVNILFFIVLFISSFVFFILLILWYRHPVSEKSVKNERYLSPKWVFGILMFFWGIWYLVYMPGLAVGDSFNSIRMGLGDQKLQNHFPIFYTVFISACMKIGYSLFHTYNAGLAIYSLIQMTALAYLLTCIINKLSKYGVNQYVLTFIIAYYALSPAFGSYSIIMWKDPIFSAMLTLFALKLIFYTKENSFRKVEILKCALLLLGICLLRNNGIYSLYVVMIAILFNKKLKKLLPAFLFTITFISLWNFSIKKLDMDKDGFIESVGIPMQQMASVVVNDGKIASEDADFLYRLLPKEQYKELFNPFRVDEIKWANDFNLDYLNANKKEFFITWFHLLKSNPKLYVKQYFMSTIGFWSMGKGLSYGEFGQVIIDNNYDIHFAKKFDKYLNRDLINLSNQKTKYIPIGILVWLGFFHGAVCLAIRKNAFIIPLFSLYSVWLTLMVGTPVAYGLRYLWVYALFVPIFIMYPKLVNTSNEK